MIGNKKEKVLQNLRDCDCNEQVIAQFMAAVEQGNKQKALALLAEHREELLQQFHKCNDCICCLDYLVNQIEKEEDKQ